jgi:hypothetical protein
MRVRVPHRHKDPRAMNATLEQLAADLVEGIVA